MTDAAGEAPPPAGAVSPGDNGASRQAGIAVPVEVREPAAAAAAAAVALPAATDGYAGFATRAIALAADGAVIGVAAWLVGIVVTLCLSVLTVPEDVTKALLGLGAVLTLMWSAVYFVVFWSTTGQTPGDRLMHIRVVNARSGRPLSVYRSLVRVLGLSLSALLLCIPFLFVLVDGRRRALHDRLARSVVVYAPKLTRRERRAQA